LFVNTAHEHIRFRYLHQDPHKMDEDQLLSGRRVHEGEVIGLVSNYSRRANGTSYHLHFDVQVPTKDGWVFVNPYMTLVAAYERLIGERGIELGEPATVSTASPETTGAVSRPATIEPAKSTETSAAAGETSKVEPEKSKRAKSRKHVRHKHGKRHKHKRPRIKQAAQ
jgi:hypothetical protein